jgi:hypothetical protein
MIFMKNIRTILGVFSIVTVVSLSACINGKGDVVTKNFPLTGFDKVDFSTQGEVILVVDQNQFVEVKSNQNIIDALKLEVRGTTLHIETKSGKNIGKYDELTIFVHAPRINKVETSASGNITGGNGIAGPGFEAKTSASGNITITEIASQDVDAETSASGNITLSGVANKCDFETDASGNIHAFGLESNETEAEVSASGNIETRTKNSLKIKISASGNVSYKGNPTLNVDNSGSGNVIDAN